eukprot:scpid97627/ scgid30458/ 
MAFQPAVIVPNFQQAFLYSLFLKAILFVSDEGEIRVSPEVHEGLPDSTKVSLKRCYRVAEGVERCMYASSSGHFLMAMRKDSGMLVTIATPQSWPPYPESSTSPHCVWFEEKAVMYTRKPFVRVITGCIASQRYQLAIKGHSIRKDQKCTPTLGTSLRYTQISANGISNPRMGLFRTMGPVSIFEAQRRRKKARLAKQLSNCTATMRESYPLSWETVDNC